MTLPRVVITGIGVVSPNGIGKEAFCRAILAGKSGVKRISRFDPSELPVHIAGEIPEFDELAWVDARERKHVSARRALSRSRLERSHPGRRSRSNGNVHGRQTRNRRDPGHGRRRPRILRRTIPTLAFRTRQASQPVLHSQRNHGHDSQRNQHALRFSRLQPRSHRRLHFLHGRHWLRLPAYSGWRATNVSGRRRGFANHSGHH